MILRTLLFVTLCVFCNEVSAAIRYVNMNATGTNNGTSWTNAYTSLSTALTASVLGDQIWVASGTYKPTATTDRTISFNLKQGVSVYGGFAGTETALNQRNWNTNLTILSGDIGTLSDTTDNSYHVLNIVNISTGTLDGFTIKKGYASGTGNYASGGGAFIQNSLLTIKNVIFQNNGSVSKGGAIYATNIGSPTLINVSFISNCVFNTASPTSTYGGAIFANYYSSPVMDSVSFSRNLAYKGGAIYNNNHCSPQISNASFSDNESIMYGHGGSYYASSIYNVLTSNPVITNTTFKDWARGVYNSQSTTTFSSCTFNDFLIWAVWNDPGASAVFSNCLFDSVNNAIEIHNASAIVDHCTFRLNGRGLNVLEGSSADISDCIFKSGAIGVEIQASSATIKRSVFVDLNGWQGAVFSLNSSAIIENCIFSKNHGFLAGGITFDAGSGVNKVTNCTFEGNYGQQAEFNFAGAILVKNSCAPLISNTVFFNNKYSSTNALTGPKSDIYDPLGTAVFNNCVLQSSQPCTGCLPTATDPLFKDINDGDGADNVWGTSDDGLSIESYSPCINGGNNSFLGTITTDITGANRILNATVDMGAYENLKVPKLLSYYCNRTLTNLNDYMACETVPGATSYRFEFTDGFNTFTYTNSGTGYRLNLNPEAMYGTTYTVRVAAMMGGVWGDYGPSCTITTPLTRMKPPYCGITVSPMNQFLACYQVSQGTQYKFKLFDGTNTLYFTSVSGGLRLSLVPGIQTNTAYQVSVSAYSNGAWSDYGPACTINSAASMFSLNSNASLALEEGEENSLQLNAFPNPSDGSFLVSSSQETELFLTNQLGQVLQRIQLNEENKFQTNIELTDAGVYFLTGNMNGIPMMKKLLVID